MRHRGAAAQRRQQHQQQRFGPSPVHPSIRRPCVAARADPREDAVKQLESYTLQMRGTLTSDSSIPVDTTAPPQPQPTEPVGLLELNQDTFHDYLGE